MNKVFHLGFLSLALVLSLAACRPSEPLVYDPVNWTESETGDQTWFFASGGLELRSFRQIQQDPRKTTFRVDFELDNQSSNTVRLDDVTTLDTRGQLFQGQIFRLFTPDNAVLAAGDYTEFAAVFDLGQPVGDVFQDRLRITFNLFGPNDETTPVELVLRRVKAD